MMTIISRWLLILTGLLFPLLSLGGGCCCCSAAAAASDAETAAASAAAVSRHRSGATTTTVTKAQVARFERDGYVMVENLLHPTILDRMSEAVAAIPHQNPKYFSATRGNAIFAGRSNAFRDVALYSNIPRAVAELLRLNATRDNLRVLRDVFMAKDIHDNTTCDWHVDDIGFWPASYRDDTGVNVWIALDDMPYQGGMAVAPGSHAAPWRHDAYAVLGQNRSTDGGMTAGEVRAFVHRTQPHYLTCDMHLVDPAMHNRIEATAVHFPNLRRGDIIFATRLLFHRTTAVTPEGVQYYESMGQTTLQRYSIRYVPGTTHLPNGWNVEWSVLHNPGNTGKSLDEIHRDNSEYAFYPQAWPSAEAPAALESVERHADAWSALAKQHAFETLFGTGDPPASVVD